MAIRKYLPGEHPAGFIGFRVTVTFSWSHLRQERYFSVKNASWGEAEEEANQVHDYLKKLADEIRREDMIYRKQCGAGPHSIATNFRAQLQIKEKNGRTSYSPQFLIDRKPGPNRRLPDVFYIQGNNLSKAFTDAVNHYVDINGLSDDDKDVLMSRMPSMSLFTQYLLPHMKRRHKNLRMRSVDKDMQPDTALPTLKQFETVLEEIELDQLPISVFHDHMLIFYRTALKKYLYAEYRYDECGGIKGAFDLAKSRWEQYRVAAEKEKNKERERTERTNPADFVRCYRGKKSNVYRVLVPGFKARSFSVPNNLENADKDLHAFRTATHYAKNLLIDGYVDEDAFRRWRTQPVYFTEDKLAQRKQAEVAKILASLTEHGLSMADIINS